jgi:hypothetical protein
MTVQKRVTTVLGLSLSLTLLASSSSPAQDVRREQRRQFVDGLLRTLIESQLKPENRGEDEQPTRVPADVAESRQLLDGFARD